MDKSGVSERQRSDAHKREGEEAFQIRPALPADAETLRNMIQELAIFERMPSAVQLSNEQVADDLHDKAIFALIAHHAESGEVAGMAIYYQAYSTWVGKYLHLEDLYVREKFRRRGLAARLLLEVVKAAHARGMKRLQWDVLEWNQPARELYEKLNAVDLAAKEGWIAYRLDEERINELVANGAQDSP